jgi:pimeloyl-ACP methyl ester carboxylesterase
VKSLGLERVVLVGHSMGGPVSLEAARRLPGRVVGLVAVDTLQDVEARHAPAEIDAFLAPFAADYKAAAEKFIRDFMFVPTSDPKLVDRVVVKTQGAPGSRRGVAERLLLTASATGDQVPIHAINGDKFPRT